MFFEYIHEIAWDSSEPIDLINVLPECNLGYVSYCEGRMVDPNNKKLVFCPKIKKMCDVGSITSSFNKNITSYNLHELLDECGIQIPSVNPKGSYVNKMTGWINGLNEKRKHLKCTKCQSLMKPVMKYAKNYASYNCTVFSCPNKCINNENVYLNHCWCCKEIIDSRESKIKSGELYICIKCGSGDEKFAPGSICPKCGLENMRSIAGKQKKCRDVIAVNVNPN